MPKITFSSVRSLENALVTARIPHAVVLSRWIFNSLIPRLQPFEYSFLDKATVELETGLKFEGKTYTALIAFLVKKRIIIQAPSDTNKNWSPHFRLGEAIGALTERMASVETDVAELKHEVRQAKVILAQVCSKLGIPASPPDYPELMAHLEH